MYILFVQNGKRALDIEIEQYSGSSGNLGFKRPKVYTLIGLL
jgi:hypothetical protein